MSKESREKEDQNIEWKLSWRDEFLKWICGFANTQGGTLIIGKDDQGNAVGLEKPDKLMEDIPNKVRDVLGIMVNVNLVSQQDVELIEIVTEPYPNAISYQGRYYFRSGSTNQELKGAALDRFLMRKQGLHWDGIPIVGIKLTELSDIQSFRKLANISMRFSNSILREEDKLLIEKLHLYNGINLKRAAILLFHNDPEKYITGAFIKIGYFESDSELIYQDEVNGSLFHQVDQTLDLLFTKYLKAIISYVGVQRIETFPVPYEAVRKAFLNAIAHKDYSSGAPIQISVYDDKLLIWNNGQLHSGWTIDDLLSKHSSQPYNPDIANAFFRAGLIETWERGIEKMSSACKKHGSPDPVITVKGDGLWIRFDFLGLQEKTSVKSTVKSTVKSKVKSKVKTSDKILDLLAKNPEMTQVEIAEYLGKSISTIEKVSRKLVKEGKLQYVGSKRKGYWEVK